MSFIVVNKKIQSLLLLGSLFLAGVSIAHADDLADLEKILNEQQAKNEKVQRAMTQELKNQIGLTELKRIETQNVMRLMLPPYIDTTMAIGSRVLTAEEALGPWQETLMHDMANYNMNTPEEDSSDDAFVGAKIKSGTGSLLDPNNPALDNLVASSLLDGLAFEDDAKAEAAYQYIQYLTNFNPVPAISDKEMYTDDTKNTLTEKGADHLMRVYKQLPFMTLAQNSLLAIHTQKQRFAEFAQGLPIGEDNAASLMEVMAYEVERRYMSADWHKEMNQMSTEGLLREMANMQAFQAYLDFERLKQGQRTEALLAAQISALSTVFTMMNPDLSDIETMGMDL